MRALKKIIKWTLITAGSIFVLLLGLVIYLTIYPPDATLCERGDQAACDRHAAFVKERAEKAAAREAARAAEKKAKREAAEAEERAKLAKIEEERRKGFHCLSKWDGSHNAVVSSLKQALRDPDSYEHIETRVTPRDEAGSHDLVMKYRARNGFGGMNIGQVIAKYQSANCHVTEIKNIN